MAVHAESSIQLSTIPAYTSLLGGHFIYNANWETAGTPHSANIVQTITKNGIDVSHSPQDWEFNTHIGANGIHLRYNEIPITTVGVNGIELKAPILRNGLIVDTEAGIQITSDEMNFYNNITTYIYTHNGVEYEAYLDEIGYYYYTGEEEHPTKQRITGSEIANVQVNTRQFAQLSIGDDGALTTGDFYHEGGAIYSQTGAKLNLSNGELLSPYLRISNGETYYSYNDGVETYEVNFRIDENNHRVFYYIDSQNVEHIISGAEVDNIQIAEVPQGAYIKGIIEALGGTIGGFNIDEQSIYTQNKVDVQTIYKYVEYTNPTLYKYFESVEVDGRTVEIEHILIVDSIDVEGEQVYQYYYIDDNGNRIDVLSKDVVTQTDTPSIEYNYYEIIEADNRVLRVKHPLTRQQQGGEYVYYYTSDPTHYVDEQDVTTEEHTIIHILTYDTLQDEYYYLVYDESLEAYTRVVVPTNQVIVEEQRDINNHSGIYLGNDGTFYIGDEDNYIRTIAGPNDSKLLEIHVNQVYFGKSENLMDFYQQTLKENNNLNNKIDENIGVVADSIIDLGQNISDITGSLNNKVDSDELLNTVTNINNSITGIQTSLNEEITNRQNGDAELLSTLSYEGYIITDNERGIIQVGKVSEDRTNYSYVRIDSGKPRSTGSSDYIPPQIVIHINDGDINEDVAYFSSEELYVPVTTTPQLHMQQRSSVGETIGKMGWIMRSNGHLSLKIV